MSYHALRKMDRKAVSSNGSGVVLEQSGKKKTKNKNAITVMEVGVVESYKAKKGQECGHGQRRREKRDRNAVTVTLVVLQGGTSPGAVSGKWPVHHRNLVLHFRSIHVLPGAQGVELVKKDNTRAAGAGAHKDLSHCSLTLAHELVQELRALDRDKIGGTSTVVKKKQGRKLSVTLCFHQL